MEHDHPASEVGAEFRHHLGRQGDFRHQDHPPPAPPDHLLEEADIHRGLAAAGDAVEQRTGRAALVHPLHNAVIGRLLLLAENDGRAIGGLRLGDPQHFHLGQRHQSALLQPLQRPHGGAGKIADFAGEGAADGAQQLHHLIAHGRAAPLRLHSGHGLLCGNRQGRLAGLFIGDLPVGGGIDGEKPPPPQLPDHRSRRLAAGQAQRLQLRAAAVGGQGLQDPALPLVGPSLQGLLPGDRQSADLPKAVPQPGGQQGLDRVIQGAEIPLPQPEGQLDLLGPQDALIVQDLADGLQPAPLAVLAHGQDEALAGFIAPAEGHSHPHPGPDLGQQLFGDQVVIWLVDGIGGGGNRHPRNIGQLHGSMIPLFSQEKRLTPL